MPNVAPESTELDNGSRYPWIPQTTIPSLFSRQHSKSHVEKYGDMITTVRFVCWGVPASTVLSMVSEDSGVSTI
jgi:hypothetical protein